MTSAKPAPASRRALRIALGQRAYDRREVRLVPHDLTGCDHVVSTRHGLFAVNPAEHRLIAHGLFFGLTVSGGDIFAFEACDEPRASSRRGRIVRLRRDGTRIDRADILAEGLSNGCHQIDLIGDTLFVTDTYRQRIVAVAPDGTLAEFDPLPLDADRRGQWECGYVHMNALIASGEERLVLLHNGADRTGHASAVARLDAQWRLIERRPLSGFGCHNLAILEDGSLLACGSFAGELIGSNGLKLKICDLMTRGLSVGRDAIVVGGSAFAQRDRRDETRGAVYFLDRDYRLTATVPMPAPPMDIRRLDGADLSLSNHVRERGLAVRWPI